MRLTPESLAAYRLQLEHLDHGNRNATVKRWAEENGVSMATMRRSLSSGDKKAPREKQVPGEWIEQIGALKAKSMQDGVAGRMLSTAACIEILENVGTIPPGALTVSTADRRLREIGFNEVRTYQRHEDDHVNHVWLLDWSRSEYFELFKQEGTDWLIKVHGRAEKLINKNKPTDELWRLWVSSTLDSYSRARIIRYHAATGENITMLRDQLQFAWLREDTRHPMRHLPSVMKLDQGSIGKNTAVIQRLKDDLGITLVRHGSKSNRLAAVQSGGKIEVRFKHLWSAEHKWATMLTLKEIRFIRLSELNEMAFEFTLAELQKKHPVLGIPVQQVYENGIAERPQRSCNTDLNLLLYRTETRIADGTGVISMYGQKMAVPEEFCNQEVQVFISPEGALVGKSIDGRKQFDIVPISMQTTAKTRELTTKEKLAQLPAPVVTEAFKSAPVVQKQIAPAAPTNVVKFQPKGEEVKPESPFSRPAGERPFENLNEMKLHICKRMYMSWDDLLDHETLGPLIPLIEQSFYSGNLTRSILNEVLDKAV